MSLPHLFCVRYFEPSTILGADAWPVPYHLVAVLDTLLKQFKTGCPVVVETTTLRACSVRQWWHVGHKAPSRTRLLFWDAYVGREPDTEKQLYGDLDFPADLK